MNSQLNISSMKHQKGAALAISLIVLLLLTILGISNMESTIMEEKMAGNTVDREKAFQAAESALRDAERLIEKAGSKIDQVVFYNAGVSDGSTTANNDGDTCLNGLCTPSDRTVSYGGATSSKSCADSTYIPERWYTCPSGTNGASRNLSVWTTATRHINYSVSANLGVAQNPAYIIEFMGYIPAAGTSTSCTDANSDGIPDAPYDVWPNCPTDPQMYRITAMGYGGSANTKVMLQSTYLKKP